MNRVQREQVGMDGYVALRFIKLCKRLCAFAAFFGEGVTTRRVRGKQVNTSSFERRAHAPPPPLPLPRTRTTYAFVSSSSHQRYTTPHFQIFYDPDNLL